MNASPQVYARIGGALYLIIIVLGMFAEGFVNHQLIVSGDAAATAHNILASRSLWRAGAAADLLVPLCALPLVMIFYVLLRPVSRPLVLISVFFNLVSLSVEAVSKLYLLSYTARLDDGAYLAAFDPRQLQALAYLELKSHDIAFNIALIFFGCACLVDGYLIFKSQYLPRVVGRLMQIAGGCYLIGCFAALFAPDLFDRISPEILIPPFVGESTLCLWLLIKGVDPAKWRERTGTDTAGFS
jgi:hypothetical protein